MPMLGVHKYIHMDRKSLTEKSLSQAFSAGYVGVIFTSPNRL